MQKVAVSPAQSRNHLPIVKEVTAQDRHTLTAWEPRSYQWELYRRAMEGDRVIFLPTGENCSRILFIFLIFYYNKIKIFSENEFSYYIYTWVWIRKPCIFVKFPFYYYMVKLIGRKLYTFSIFSPFWFKSSNTDSQIRMKHSLLS